MAQCEENTVSFFILEKELHKKSYFPLATVHISRFSSSNICHLIKCRRYCPSIGVVLSVMMSLLLLFALIFWFFSFLISSKSVRPSVPSMHASKKHVEALLNFRITRETQLLIFLRVKLLLWRSYRIQVLQALTRNFTYFFNNGHNFQERRRVKTTVSWAIASHFHINKNNRIQQ